MAKVEIELSEEAYDQLTALGAFLGLTPTEVLERTLVCKDQRIVQCDFCEQNGDSSILTSLVSVFKPKGWFHRVADSKLACSQAHLIELLDKATEVRTPHDLWRRSL